MGREYQALRTGSVLKDWRTFRVDRIQEKVKAGPRFVPREPPARDLADYVSSGGSMSSRRQARVKVLAAAGTVAARLPPGIGTIEAIDAESCWFSVGAFTFESLAMHLVFLGFDFEVSEPAGLVEEVKRLAARYWRAAGV